MANITSQNPIRWQIDTLTRKLTGVIASSSSSYVDLSGANFVKAITIGGTQPANSTRHFAFRVNDRWGKLSTSGTFSPFTSNSADFLNISENGNTPEQISALVDIPALAGQKFGFAIALSTTDPDNSLPTCSLTFTCTTNTQQLQNVHYSPIYELGANAQIISLNAETSSSNGGSVTLQAQATLDDDTVTGWKGIDTFAGQKCKAIQFKGDYRAVTVGVSSAKIESANVIYADGSSITTGLADGAIVTKTINWYMPIHTCRLTVNHAPLDASTIKCYVAFRDAPKIIKGEALGIGAGRRQTFQMNHTGGIKYDSFVLYFDNVRVFTDYELNSEVGRVTCIAPEGAIVSCDYEYGWDFEQWNQMNLSSRISMDAYDRSEYRLTIPSNLKTMAAIKIVLGTASGHIDNEILGTGTGTARSYKLSHRILEGRVTLTSNGVAIASQNWRLLDDPQYVSVAAGAGAVIRASYDWLSEQPVIYQFSAVFAE